MFVPTQTEVARTFYSFIRMMIKSNFRARTSIDYWSWPYKPPSWIRTFIKTWSLYLWKLWKMEMDDSLDDRAWRWVGIELEVAIEVDGWYGGFDRIIERLVVILQAFELSGFEGFLENFERGKAWRIIELGIWNLFLTLLHGDHMRGICNVPIFGSIN